MKPKPFNVKRAKKQLDTLWSRAIRDRDGYCQKCGALGVGQAAHIFSRRNLTTRWDKENGVTLCYACHIHWAHRRPVEFALWVMEKLGREKFKALEKRTREPYDSSNFKTDFEKIKKTLTNKTIKEILREVSMVLDEQFSGTNWYRGVDIQLKDFIGSLLSRIQAQTRAEDLAAAEELKKELEGMDMDINAADAIHKFFEKLKFPMLIKIGGDGTGFYICENCGKGCNPKPQPRSAGFMQLGKMVECGHCNPKLYSPGEPCECVCHDDDLHPEIPKLKT